MDYKKANAPSMPLMIEIALLISFGLLMLSSASQVIGIDQFGDPYYYLKHQVFFGLLPGLIVLLVTMSVPYHFLRKVALPFSWTIWGA